MHGRIAFSILMSFLTISLSGFLAMGHSLRMIPDGCVASVFTEAPCPHGDPVAFYSFHVEMFKHFMSVTARALLDTMGMLFAAALLVAVLLRTHGQRLLESVLRVLRVSSGPVDRLRPPERIRCWLAHFEHSPSCTVIGA